MITRSFPFLALLMLGAFPVRGEEPTVVRRLYVAEPGIRNYLEYGGHGILVFDIDHGHKFVKRIKTSGLEPKTGKPENVKGICACAATNRVYVSTTRTLTCLDLTTEEILWEKELEGGCDRMSISPDGSNLYVPSFEKEHWNVVDGKDGHVISRIEPRSGSHNTVYGRDGKSVYLAGLRSPLLTIADTSTHKAARTVGPFSAPIRPFTVNGKSTYCYANVNSLLGFEIGDISGGKMIHRVEIQGYKQGPVKRHGCPSHGIAMTPDESEIWVSDGHNCQVHVFDATVMPPKKIASIPVRDQPGWITFSIDGRYAYPSTGDVIEVKSRKVITTLQDEKGQDVGSEKMLEIDFAGGAVVRAGDQFGRGRKR